MKINKYSITGTLVLLVALLLPSMQVKADTPARIGMYRLYNYSIADHFYTSNSAEAQAATASGYTMEGTMGDLENIQTATNTPLFRLYSPGLNNHFYTASSVERDQAMQRGFNLEGVMGYVPVEGTTIQAYRMYNSASGDHFYTTSLDERNQATNYGYVTEGMLSFLFVPITINPGGTTSIPTGTWGGMHLGMTVKDSDITLEYDCAHGTMNQPVAVDANGNFSATGLYVQDHGGPAIQGEVLPTYPVSYSGNITGNLMTLTVTRTDVYRTDQTANLGTYQVTFGQSAQVTKCL